MKKHIYLIAFLFILTSCNKLSSIETLFSDEVILNDEFEYFDDINFKLNNNSSFEYSKYGDPFEYSRGAAQQFMNGENFSLYNKFLRKYLKYKGRPFNGKLKTYYVDPKTLENLTVNEISIYKDGKLNGAYIKKNQLGQTVIEADFKNGYLNGNYKFYELSETEGGQKAIVKILDANFKDGLLDGEYTKYDNKGELLETKIFRNGKRPLNEKLIPQEIEYDDKPEMEYRMNNKVIVLNDYSKTDRTGQYIRMKINDKIIQLKVQEKNFKIYRRVYSNSEYTVTFFDIFYGECRGEGTQEVTGKLIIESKAEFNIVDFEGADWQFSSKECKETGNG